MNRFTVTGTTIVDPVTTPLSDPAAISTPVPVEAAAIEIVTVATAESKLPSFTLKVNESVPLNPAVGV